MSGFFDFYFAGVDAFAFDIAVCLNDWCIDLDTGRLVEPRAAAFVAAYETVRPLTGGERRLMPALLRAAALRFWLSRLVRPASAARRGAAAGARPVAFRAHAARAHSTAMASRSAALRLATVPPARGAHWVALGWKVFAQKPLAFSGLFAFFLFIALAALLLPWVGPLLMLALLPLLTLGFMIATRDALADRFPLPAVFWRPLAGDAARRRTLIRLGLAYAVGGLLIMLLSDAIDGGRFEQLQAVLGGASEDDRRRASELLDDPRLQFATLLRLALTALLSVPFWHAPALVHWAGQNVGQALFSSVLALWSNRGAFTVYLLVWTAIVFGFGIAVGAIAAVTGARTLLAVIALPAGLTFSAVFYASLYFTYRDSFIASDGGAALPPP